MRHSAEAIAASIAMHGALAAVLAVGHLLSPVRDAAAEIDVSAVELSLSDVEDEPRREACGLSASATRASARASVACMPEAPRIGSQPPEPARDEVHPMPPAPELTSIEPPDSAVPRIDEASAPPEGRAAAEQARIEAPPRPLKTIRPVYPRGARRRGEQGDVALEIRVDEAGGVGGVSIASSSGFAELDAAAAEAVRVARFEPARSGGMGVASTARLLLSFRLRQP
ncbi:MAG: TonB family protein [Kiritimatiellae bacterium]|nr:TonB family protein [Kiritimatiellia bacterium]